MGMLSLWSGSRECVEHQIITFRALPHMVTHQCNTLLLLFQHQHSIISNQKISLNILVDGYMSPFTFYFFETMERSCNLLNIHTVYTTRHYTTKYASLATEILALSNRDGRQTLYASFNVGRSQRSHMIGCLQSIKNYFFNGIETVIFHHISFFRHVLDITHYNIIPRLDLQQREKQLLMLFQYPPWQKKHHKLTYLLQSKAIILNFVSSRVQAVLYGWILLTAYTPSSP